MAAIQISIRGQGNVPDAAVSAIRAHVKALVQACADAGAADLLRVDFAPVEEEASQPDLPMAAAPVVAAAPSPPPLEAAVLDRPQPRGRTALPLEPKVPVDKEDT